MTTQQFYSEYWKPLLLTIIPTILLTGFATFMGVKVALAVHQEQIKQNKESIVEIKKHNEIYDRSVYELQQDCQFIKGSLNITNTRGNS